MAHRVWHEAQNQLFIIEGSVDLLDTSGSEEARAHRERIERACVQIDLLLRGLRDAVGALDQALAEPHGSTEEA
jgi:hypothetical protein